MTAVSVDGEGLARVVDDFSARWTSAAADIERCLAAQVADDSHREVVGPLLAASGSSGVVRVGGAEVASWGDPHEPEMAFSVTKSVVSVVAGLAFDDGLLVPDQPVHEVVDAAGFTGPHGERITWRHLLQQSSPVHVEPDEHPADTAGRELDEGTTCFDPHSGRSAAQVCR